MAAHQQGHPSVVGEMVGVRVPLHATVSQGPFPWPSRHEVVVVVVVGGGWNGPQVSVKISHCLCSAAAVGFLAMIPSSIIIRTDSLLNHFDVNGTWTLFFLHDTPN